MASTLTVHTRALLRRDSEGRLSVRRYFLRVRGRGGRPRAIHQRLVVGSGPEVDVRLEDGTVSRAHLELIPSAVAVTVRDLGSKNGTFVGPVRVRDVQLDASTTLKVGRSELELLVEDEALAEPRAQPSFGGLVGDSAAMRAVYGQLALIALSDSAVLLRGEPGTGKGAMARALHDGSPRAGGPFEVVDCAALNVELAESLLFGHVRGAFTGAERGHRGAFARAHGGTLFLDHVGELSLAVQPKLLRALETHQVQPVGAEASEAVDVRVVSASSRPLEAPHFRQDLYFRLAVLEVLVPALRDRPGDEAALACHFARQRGGASLPEGFLRALPGRRWPGNLRELENAVERFLVYGSTDVALEASPAALPEGPGGEERARVTRALAACGGNQSAAARLLGVSRGTLIERIARFGLPRPRGGA